jgi:glycosyltransferase involved in cell wall biosynthesis
MYNEQEIAETFFSAIIPVLNNLNVKYELICIDDGSEDETLIILKSIQKLYSNITIIELSRNFGKDYALAAGIEHAGGEAIVTIDADLQDPPSLIPEMLEMWHSGYDMVVCVRQSRKHDTFVKRVSSTIFYKVINALCKPEITNNAGDFRLFSSELAEALSLLPERTRFTKGLFAWLGYKKGYIYHERPERPYGKTKWSLWKLWNFGLDGIFSFSTLPLRIWWYTGFFLSVLSGLYLVYYFIKTMLFGIDLPGYPSLLSFILFFSGVILFALGVFGEYLGRIFLETKKRPLYLIKNVHYSNFKKKRTLRIIHAKRKHTKT